MLVVVRSFRKYKKSNPKTYIKNELKKVDTSALLKLFTTSTEVLTIGPTALKINEILNRVKYRLAGPMVGPPISSTTKSEDTPKTNIAAIDASVAILIPFLASFQFLDLATLGNIALEKFWKKEAQIFMIFSAKS